MKSSYGIFEEAKLGDLGS